MRKRFMFIFFVFFLLFLLIQFIKTGYKNSQRTETLRNWDAEIRRDEIEIAKLTMRAKWGDTAAARVYLKKLNANVRLPGERMLVLVPKPTEEYSVNTAISEAKAQERDFLELSVPEKWNNLLFGTR